MPIVRIADKLVYFAHVPKCAGTAVERYLQTRFGPLGLRDARYLLRPEARRWSKSSPQHIDVEALGHLLPLSLFDTCFAVVRHPVSRISSVFRYQRDVEVKIDPNIPFRDWLDDLAEQQDRDPYYLDNHPRPMCDFIPEGTEIFRMEDGLAPVVDWLDDLAGTQEGAREIPLFNSYAQGLAKSKVQPGPPPEITAEIKARIAALYAKDFERFGYSIEDIEAETDREST
jgi:hypothetical protein